MLSYPLKLKNIIIIIIVLTKYDDLFINYLPSTIKIILLCLEKYTSNKKRILIRQ